MNNGQNKQSAFNAHKYVQSANFVKCFNNSDLTIVTARHRMPQTTVELGAAVLYTHIIYIIIIVCYY
jgi:hypothetical protein